MSGGVAGASGRPLPLCRLRAFFGGLGGQSEFRACCSLAAGRCDASRHEWIVGQM
jgi:hypothetical protein